MSFIKLIRVIHSFIFNSKRIDVTNELTFQFQKMFFEKRFHLHSNSNSISKYIFLNKNFDPFKSNDIESNSHSHEKSTFISDYNFNDIFKYNYINMQHSISNRHSFSTPLIKTKKEERRKSLIPKSYWDNFDIRTKLFGHFRKFNRPNSFFEFSNCLSMKVQRRFISIGDSDFESIKIDQGREYFYVLQHCREFLKKVEKIRKRNATLIYLGESYCNQNHGFDLKLSESEAMDARKKGKNYSSQLICLAAITKTHGLLGGKKGMTLFEGRRPRRSFRKNIDSLTFEHFLNSNIFPTIKVLEIKDPVLVLGNFQFHTGLSLFEPRESTVSELWNYVREKKVALPKVEDEKSLSRKQLVKYVTRWLSKLPVTDRVNFDAIAKRPFSVTMAELKLFCNFFNISFVDEEKGRGEWKKGKDRKGRLGKTARGNGKQKDSKESQSQVQSQNEVDEENYNFPVDRKSSLAEKVQRFVRLKKTWMNRVETLCACNGVEILYHPPYYDEFQPINRLFEHVSADVANEYVENQSIDDVKVKFEKAIMQWATAKNCSKWIDESIEEEMRLAESRGWIGKKSPEP